jgi:hypothetical protein
MGWEGRKGTSHRYYTRSLRCSGIVIRLYLGRGETACLLATSFAEIAAGQAALRKLMQARRATWKGIIGEMDANARETVPFVDTIMIAAGYHRHKRTWRRRRQRRSETVGNTSTAADLRTLAPPAEIATAEPPPTREMIHSLAKQAEKGDREALTKLRQALRHPAALSQFGRDHLTPNIELFFLAKNPDNLLEREVNLAHVDRLRSELLGPEPTPIERLLVDRIILDRLLLSRLEAVAAVDTETRVVQQPDFQAALHRGHCRFLASVMTLTRVRQLALPALAALQVSIAGVCSAEG